MLHLEHLVVAMYNESNEKVILLGTQWQYPLKHCMYSCQLKQVIHFRQK